MESEQSADTFTMRELQALVLASTSLRRFELLTSLGIDVSVVPSGVDETDQPGLTPSQPAAFHASAKAYAVVVAYGVQGRGAALVERIESDFYAVIGFPIGAFVRVLSELRYALPHSALRTAHMGAA